MFPLRVGGAEISGMGENNKVRHFELQENGSMFARGDERNVNPL